MVEEDDIAQDGVILSSFLEEEIESEETMIDAEYDSSFLGPDYDYQVYESAESWFPEDYLVDQDDTFMGVSLMTLLALAFIAIVAAGMYKKYVASSVKTAPINEDAEMTRNLAEALISGERK